MKKIDLKSIVAELEDELIKEFDHFSRTSSICIEGQSHDIEASYDALTGKVEVSIYSEGCKSYPNICRTIENAISTEKIDNEIHFEELRDEEEYEAEMDNRIHQCRINGWGYGIYWR